MNQLLVGIGGFGEVSLMINGKANADTAKTVPINVNCLVLIFQLKIHIDRNQIHPHIE